MTISWQINGQIRVMNPTYTTLSGLSLKRSQGPSLLSIFCKSIALWFIIHSSKIAQLNRLGKKMQSLIFVVMPIILWSMYCCPTVIADWILNWEITLFSCNWNACNTSPRWQKVSTSVWLKVKSHSLIISYKAYNHKSPMSRYACSLFSIGL